MDAIESLIRAIAENPIVSAVLLWLIGAFFSRVFKSGEKNPEQQKKQNSRPVAYQEPEKQLQETVQTVYERVQREHKTDKKPDHRGSENELSVVKLSRAAKHRKKSAVQSPAVQGIIWAEITGKPRSVNPHYTRQRK
ncbi:hypothetical protein J9317_13310 [Metabacillus sp. KIGAM252]|uniref:Uncharacterized protein n=1 Tax=Metabacillus flavus TaxID=2823519 RepID=A0ABS5LG70_9BACI|nr:hypothetical protein [Metabacillus flavus]MBS2969745.1 hypothetical protein [Metabacillus flavus]